MGGFKLRNSVFRFSVFSRYYFGDIKSIRSLSKQMKMFSSDACEQKACIEGVNINYVKVGNGPKPVLCLPGAMGSIWSDFKPQVEKLDKNKLTIVAWDPPGYGHSRPPNRDFSAGFFHKDADLAAKLMKVLNFEKFSLLGWSDGGITSLIMASKYQDNIDKLVVWGANAYLTSEDLKIYQGIKDISKWSEAMRAPLIALYGEEYFRKTWEAWVDAFVDIYEKEGGDLCISSLPKIECPTLVVHGAKDPMVPEEHPKYLVENIKNSRLHIFEKGKHNLHLRFADEFNKLVEDFFTGIK